MHDIRLLWIWALSKKKKSSFTPAVSSIYVNTFALHNFLSHNLLQGYSIEVRHYFSRLVLELESSWLRVGPARLGIEPAGLILNNNWRVNKKIRLFGFFIYWWNYCRFCLCICVSYYNAIPRNQNSAVDTSPYFAALELRWVNYITN